MYRLNITKERFGDLIVLLLFDKAFNEEFLKESELFNSLRELMDNQGIKKSKLFSLYFDIDPILRGKYKQFSKKVEEKNASVFIMESEKQQNEGYEEQLIMETVKRVTGKENPNEEKVQELIEDLLKNKES